MRLYLHLPNSGPAALLGVTACFSPPPESVPDTSTPPDTGYATQGDAPDPSEQSLAIQDWAGRYDILALVTIDAAAARRVDIAPGIVTDATLIVDAVLRDDLDVGLQPDERIWMTVPGGELDDFGVITSKAPGLAEGDEILAGLTLEDGALAFQGNRAALPLRDGALQVCVNPDLDALLRCREAGAAALPSEGLPHFSRADDAMSVPVDRLFTIPL